ncbi:MAG: hypothetical protein KGJ01_00360 [Patescibacteria group bacterium]|nr:hypothetical protein [Patescibacteria group bacterium]
MEIFRKTHFHEGISSASVKETSFRIPFPLPAGYAASRVKVPARRNFVEDFGWGCGAEGSEVRYIYLPYGG